MLRRLVITVLATAVATASPAQDAAEDWELLRPEAGTSMAASRFDNGIVVGVRCIGDSLETMISGLPLAERRTFTRTLEYAFGDEPLRESSWWIGQSRATIFSDFPAGLAREMREGGVLQIRVPPDDGEPARRFVVTLPPSAAAIDTVLTACGRPSVDPRDALRSSVAGDTPRGLSWARLPRPNYPTGALERGIDGRVVLSCLSNGSGAIEDCQIESERPARYDFGRAALRAARDARLRSQTGETSELRRGIVVFTINFRIP